VAKSYTAAFTAGFDFCFQNTRRRKCFMSVQFILRRNIALHAYINTDGHKRLTYCSFIVTTQHQIEQLALLGCIISRTNCYTKFSRTRGNQWCIAKNGGGYTQRGVAKGLKVPCLFMITEVSIRCQKNPWRLVYGVYPRIPPQYTTGDNHLSLSHVNYAILYHTRNVGRALISFP